MNEVDDLILGPFRDIVQKAELAVDNAGDDHADMASAASTLLKAGRRAVSHIEPLCSRYLDDYGSAFIAAVKDNG